MSTSDHHRLEVHPLYWITVSPAARRRILLSTTLLAAFVLGRFGLWAAGEAVPATGGIQPLRGVPVQDQRLALTFDVTWGDTIPTRVLDTLKLHQARATFFVSGPWAAGHPDLLRRMVQEGHDVGNHGYQHIDLRRYPREVVREEIAKAQAAIEAVTGKRPIFFRAPNGDVSEQVVETAAGLGYTVVLWGTDAQDWATPGPDYIARRVLARANPGDIIRFNAGDSAVDTPDALAPVLAGLSEKGLRPVPLSQLLNAAGTPPE